MEEKECVQCGNVFLLTDSEKKYFEDRNLNYPKRCKDCRDMNKSHQAKANTYQVNTYQVTSKKESNVMSKITYLILAIMIIALSILYIKSQISSDNYKSTQETDTSDSYTFRSESLLQEHFEKHGSEFGYTSSSQYESKANDVINSSKALYKTEAEDGDSVYYIEASNELVILSTDGYIRTFFKPEDGIEYYNRQ